MNHLAQARGSHLSENSWEPDVFHFSCSSNERPHLWAKSILAQARRTRPSENSWNLQDSLLVVLPKREPVAWAKDPFRLSEGPWLERYWCWNLLYGCYLPCFRLLVVWLIGLPYLKHEVCEYACVIWLYGIGIDELGMNKCMNHDWLNGWILAWDWYAWEIYGWLVRHGYGMKIDVILWDSWWDL